MADIDITDDVSPSSPVQKCSICGKRLSRYNELGRCFHHPDPEKEHRQREREARRARCSPKPLHAPVIGPTDGPAASLLKDNRPLQDRLITAVCETLGVTRMDLELDGRGRRLVRARHVLMYLLYTDTTLSYSAIGRLLGDRDHTTVIHSVRSIRERLAVDPDLENVVRYLRSKYR